MTKGMDGIAFLAIPISKTQIYLLALAALGMLTIRIMGTLIRTSQCRRWPNGMLLKHNIFVIE